MIEPTISFEEWKKEIDAARANHELNDIQYKFVDYARNNSNPLPWPKLVSLYNKVFSTTIARSTLYDWYERKKQQEDKR